MATFNARAETVTEKPFFREAFERNAALSRCRAIASYGPDPNDELRCAAEYVDRILKGEKPGDLAVPAGPGHLRTQRLWQSVRRIRPIKIINEPDVCTERCSYSHVVAHSNDNAVSDC